MNFSKGLLEAANGGLVSSNKAFNGASQGALSSIISDISQVTQHNNRNKSLNASYMANTVFQNSASNPSIENLLKDMMKFTEDDQKDPELQEI